jgi:hypothetical protein
MGELFVQEPAVVTEKGNELPVSETRKNDFERIMKDCQEEGGNGHIYS